MICFSAKAQTDFLGKNEKYIKGYIKYIHVYVFQDSTVTIKGNDEVTTLVYHPIDSDTTGLMPITFLFKNDTCKLFMISSTLSDLPIMVTSLNKHYQRLDDSHWIDKSNTYEATLDKQTNGFYISFKKL